MYASITHSTSHSPAILKEAGGCDGSSAGASATGYGSVEKNGDNVGPCHMIKLIILGITYYKIRKI